ncbi:MAG TPA: BON domain-containing protein [Robiginitalea sp.]|nr:BON domain-containing protein [Robiginitalea sp.]
MKADEDIKKDVLEELNWQPDIDETQIGVIVEEGIVTLTGTLDSFAKKLAAERAVKKVAGVRGLAMDVQVLFGEAFKRTDSEIARAAADALKWNATVPQERIMLKVEDGRVFLSGKLEWGYQKYAAINVLRHLQGVREVHAEDLVVEPRIRVVDVRHKIERALERLADVDATSVEVDVHGDTVFLKGSVRSVIEKEAAEHAAFRAPGVRKVINELKVRYYPVTA